MTFSIVAHDVATGQVGIAVASRTLATGARVPHIRTGVGAIASQARVNRHYGPRGLALLASGASAADTVRLLVATDEEQDIRQVHLMDRMGRFAAHTGAKCQEWCGHLVKETYSVAGNILAGRRRARGHGRGLRGGEASCRWRRGWWRPCRQASRPAATSVGGSRRRCSSTATRTGRCSTSGSTITPIRSPSSDASSSWHAAHRPEPHAQPLRLLILWASGVSPSRNRIVREQTLRRGIRPPIS